VAGARRRRLAPRSGISENLTAQKSQKTLKSFISDAKEVNQKHEEQQSYGRSWIFVQIILWKKKGTWHSLRLLLVFFMGMKSYFVSFILKIWGLVASHVEIVWRRI
jgi:hypothetical protein